VVLNIKKMKNTINNKKIVIILMLMLDDLVDIISIICDI
jgi:hypothetical protein